MLIRPAVPADAEAVETIRIVGWQSAYRGIISDAFLDGLQVDARRQSARLADTGDGRFSAVAESDGALLGFVTGGEVRDNAEPAADGRAPAEVYAIYVDPTRTREGIGTRLLDAALERLDGRDVVLWVLRDNLAARAFYAARGFQRDGAEKALETRSVPLREDGATVIEVRYRRIAGEP